MKLRVSLALPGGETRDVTISVDATATVGDVARTLIRAGVTADPELEAIARQRLAPVTLLGRAPRESGSTLLDPMAPIASSGLQSGWAVTPVLEFGPHGLGTRNIEISGFVRVHSGAQRGAQFSLVAGSNPIGRERGSRIHLIDPSVSRRHAEITVDSEHGVAIRDLGSANGLLVNGRHCTRSALVGPSKIRLGEVELLVVPAPTPGSQPAQALSHAVAHTRSPRLVRYFPGSSRELPSPPTPQEPHGMPVLAMLAPLLMGVLMYGITRSTTSLVMIAFSPAMMIGSWLDGTLGARRKLKRGLKRFRETLAIERRDLAGLRDREVAERAVETPTLAEIADAIERRGPLLWARRAEHRAFLEVRFGEGALPSRTELVLPRRRDVGHRQWRELQSVAEQYRRVEPVPVIERLDRCGSIGVAGDALRAEGLARALVLQFAGLHSPGEVVLACFTCPRQRESWGWLAWLPHVDPVGGPLRGWQIADSEQSSTRLIEALEGLLEARAAHARRTVRSHLDPGTRNDAEQGDAVRELPALPAVIVLVLEHRLVEQSRLIALAEAGPDVGIHIIWVAQRIEQLPAACRTFVEFDASQGPDEASPQVGFVRSGSVVPLSDTEFLDAAQAMRLARELAPVEDAAVRVLDESDLPGAVDLRELHDIDLLGGPGSILRAWETAGSLASSWRQGQERVPTPLSAVVGQGATGRAVIDLRLQGPHALVGGTTGAGKSEFLQSWIMSLAANVSPERITFLLIDYKGGAAFAECVDLPHTVGLVTDLSPRLVRRALTSLRAELRHREELLARRGAKDLITMERGSDPDTPPSLVIAIDEFAALAADVPEFIDGVIDIAQRGRSLGLHLIMATQRPAGVISDSLRANTNLRIALRMADEHDSTDVLGVPDAAFFDAETPGRGAIKAGQSRIQHFQTGYLGGRASRENRAPEIVVRSLGLAEGEPWELPSEPQPKKPGPPRARDIERLRDGIIRAAEQADIAPPRRPWLAELPELIDLETLHRESIGAGRPPCGDSVVIGLLDDPAAQAQHPASIDLEEAGGAALIGAGGTGKTCALIALAAALSGSADRNPVQLYAIDAGGGALDALGLLPTVGAVAQLADLELIGRILQRLLDLIAERGPRYAAARAGGLRAYRLESGQDREPRVVLLLDGLTGFRQATEGLGLGGARSPFEMLNEIMMSGRAVGVHVVLTSERPSAIPASMTSNLQQRFVLRLADSGEYGSVDVHGDALEDAPPGRALAVGDAREIQFALLGGRRELSAQAMELAVLAQGLRARRIARAPTVVNAPARLSLDELEPSAGDRPSYGIDVRSLDPVGMPVAGLGVIAGPSGSGVSQAALSCTVALERWAAEHGEAVDAVLLTFVGGELTRARQWARIARGAEEVATVAGELTEALGGTPASRGAEIWGGGLFDEDPPSERGASDPAGAPAFPRPRSRGVIVVERSTEAEDTAALPQLVALAKAARRSGVLVIFEFESGRASGVWELFSALKQPGWGLSLQPDDDEAQTPFREGLGRVRRVDFPPGRGFAIEGGRVTPIHVAVAPEPSARLSSATTSSAPTPSPPTRHGRRAGALSSPSRHEAVR